MTSWLNMYPTQLPIVFDQSADYIYYWLFPFKILEPEGILWVIVLFKEQSKICMFNFTKV